MEYKNIELSYIVPVYIENRDCDLLQRFICEYESYSSDILDRVQFIFVDDHSPVAIHIPDCKLHYVLARIDDDITWNQGGARNLGAHLAKTSKLILTDLDHIFPETLLADILSAKEPSCLYMFRRERDGLKIHSHPNTFFCTKGIFFNVLGVDEEFCGHYGYEDVFFIEMQKAVGTNVKKFSRKRIVLHEHKNSVGELHHLVRDVTVNKALLLKKQAALKTKKIFSGHSRLFLNFKWSLLEEK